jgi:hypothetical protein
MDNHNTSAPRDISSFVNTTTNSLSPFIQTEFGFCGGEDLFYDLLILNI